MLGEKTLFERSLAVKKEELPMLIETIGDMSDTLADFKKKNNWGTAVAAVHIGVKKRIIYCLFSDEPAIMINPVIEFVGLERQQYDERCLCFPMLGTKVSRYNRCRVKYRDMLWRNCEILLQGEQAARMQHLCDHLDGVLAVSRINGIQSLFYRKDENPFQK